ncbi:hypothetical protein LRS06_10045 [Hymenobacter sp. J193]|uniref:hypothetical protein n=1 Tax=Hymenobacter sp. J193 TaxID=2898429 RepID=UPI0021514053|nr:hypothetical protein [Hymenobacter sp. J193]MCR5888108.1 hypothetical protein [Hymenobacter sp. J193]
MHAAGTFTVEDAWYITSRGCWVLVGEIQGEFGVVRQLLFATGVLLPISQMCPVNVSNKNRIHKTGLITSAHFASRQELLHQQIIGATAQVLE